MPTAFCNGWRQEIAIPDGIRGGDIFDCPDWAGLSLRASEDDGIWSVTEVKKASCAVGDETVVLPNDVQPGDIVECHGVKQRVTLEFGAYALEKVQWPLEAILAPTGGFTRNENTYLPDMWLLPCQVGCQQGGGCRLLLSWGRVPILLRGVRRKIHYWYPGIPQKNRWFGCMPGLLGWKTAGAGRHVEDCRAGSALLRLPALCGEVH